MIDCSSRWPYEHSFYFHIFLVVTHTGQKISAKDPFTWLWFSDVSLSGSFLTSMFYCSMWSILFWYQFICFWKCLYTFHFRFSHTNPLHQDVFKSVARFEAEVVAMTAALLGSKEKASGGQICGNMTSGGTESILLAVKTSRDYMRAKKGITKPEMYVANFLIYWWYIKFFLVQ